MMSASASVVISLVGWRYIPDLAARKALPFIHHIFTSRGWSVPKPGTLQWHKHYRYTFAAVILCYLTYNLVNALRSSPPSLYDILGAPPNAEEMTLKQAFRAFARKNHPDHVGPQGEDAFIAVRDAFESLKNPTTRFAYDRFGSDALKWTDLKTEREFLKRGLLKASMFHIFTGVILLGMSAVSGPSPVGFWRYILFATLFALELSLLLGHEIPRPITIIFPNKIPFQHIAFLHQLFIFLSMALTRVVPVLFPPDDGIRPDDPRTYKPFIDRLSILSKALDSEIMRSLHMELHAAHGSESSATFSHLNACKPSKEVIDALTREMEDMMVEDRLRKEGPVRPLWDVVIAERRKQKNDVQGSGSIKEESTSMNVSAPVTVSSAPIGPTEDTAENMLNSAAPESPDISAPQQDFVSHSHV